MDFSLLIACIQRVIRYLHQTLLIVIKPEGPLKNEIQLPWVAERVLAALALEFG